MLTPPIDPRALRAHWALDPEVLFLNHGSFGACPTAVLAHQRELRARLERQPVQFFVRDLQGLLDTAREAAAAFVGADPAGFAFVPNATTGVNAILRSLSLSPGDALLVTNHGYPACSNTVEYVAARAGATVQVAEFPFHGITPDAVVDAVLDTVTEQTRVALIDHITSPTGLVLPVARLVSALRERGVAVLIDGAHAPGMLDLDVTALGATWYVGNFHKWTCAPKGAAFMYAAPEVRGDLHPVVISHGYSAPLSSPEQSRFRVEFDWTGTMDPTAWLATPFAMEYVGGLVSGGWPRIREHTHRQVVAAQKMLAEALQVERPCPDSMLGTLAAVPLPDAEGPPPQSPLYVSPLQDALLEEHGIEVPVVPWPSHPARLIRVSAALYNHPDEYGVLAQALTGYFGTGS